MSEDDLGYLQPGFDLTTLTVARLRSILVSHDVSYPASAKKPQLIQILSEQVLPKSRKILNARARIKRTSKGITDVPSSTASSTVDDDAGDEEAEPMPPPPPKTPRGRKSKATLAAEVAAADAAEVAEATRQKEAAVAAIETTDRRKTPSVRQSNIKHPRASDTEADAEKPRPSARKTRKSIPAPAPVHPRTSVTIDEPHLPIKRENQEKGDSPFTDDNPFQSGSSPNSESRRVSASTSRTRKSLGSSTEKRKSTGGRASTTSPKITQQSDGATAPSQSTFEFPVPRFKSETVEPDDIPITEEFSPEEQLELIRDRAAKGYSGSELLQAHPSALIRRQKKQVSTATMTPLWAVLVVLFGAIGVWYRQEKINVGYCGIGESSWSLKSNTHFPDWISDKLEPSCEPCPQHAFCSANMEVTCADDYVLKPHPLSLGRIIPLPPTCEPDGEKSRRVKAVADKAIEELRERRAAYECGDEVKDAVAGGEHAAIAGKEAKSVIKGGVKKLEFAEEELKVEVGKMRRKGMSGEEFEDLWRSALGEIMGREEVEVVQDGSDRKYLSSTSLARLPFGCTIRRSIRLSISRNRVPLLALGTILSAVIWTYFRIITYKQATAQIPLLVATTLDRLATQAALAADGRVSEAFISVGQLRDDVLRATFSVKERERVWKGVSTIVERNANVRAATREGGRTGEWSRVWEWIGPVNLAPGLEGRKSGGGGLVMAPDSGAGDGSAEVTRRGGETAHESREWDEGRPIY